VFFVAIKWRQSCQIFVRDSIGQYSPAAGEYRLSRRISPWLAALFPRLIRKEHSMFEPMCLAVRRAGMIAAIAGFVFCATIAQAKPSESGDAPVGRIDFDGANLPPANVELDLSQGMFANLFGIGDAAVAGVAETLMKSTQGEHAESMHMAADQLAAVRQIIGLAGKVVHEVRIRAYEKSPGDLSSRFDKQLHEGEWEKVAVLRKGDDNARVFIIYRNDSIRGAFVMAGSHDGQVLVNVVCDISPDNVKSLTSAATKIGLDNNLQQVIEMKFHKGHGPNGPMQLKVQQQPPAPQPPKRDAE
jgi:hypothetical protein